jgi:hypothetical protein
MATTCRLAPATAWLPPTLAATWPGPGVRVYTGLLHTISQYTQTGVAAQAWADMPGYLPGVTLGAAMEVRYQQPTNTLGPYESWRKLLWTVRRSHPPHRKPPRAANAEPYDQFLDRSSLIPGAVFEVDWPMLELATQLGSRYTLSDVPGLYKVWGKGTWKPFLCSICVFDGALLGSKTRCTPRADPRKEFPIALPMRTELLLVRHAGLVDTFCFAMGVLLHEILLWEVKGPF